MLRQTMESVHKFFLLDAVFLLLAVCPEGVLQSQCHRMTEKMCSARNSTTKLTIREIYDHTLQQCLSQDLETGCLKLAVVKFLGVQIFKGDHSILIFQP